ncbi:MAG: AAA family ATPase [candidate division KSB1 bacterium]|nr:AAA family ATPase [candidate division KSB1 bacterium]MDZ7294003.1 AAA family ATPase [candidate division KSB1 bacterium]MDZ7385374.1 AAA family ATPase [candidate division KSB1 bacterium]MDZ7392214.1 AAA family ATPase [candidate division KSB1 bacterium]MDZ7413724.1 AAA family ATPase [candidate division KSB1 bacterium]
MLGKSRKQQKPQEVAETRKLSAVIVEPEEASVQLIEEVLNEIGVFDPVVKSPNLTDGMQQVRTHRPDLLILSGVPNASEALSFLTRAALSLPNMTAFFTADSGSPELLLESMRAGAREYLVRPIDRHELAAAVRRFLNTKVTLGLIPQKAGKVVSVYGVKGGLGATTIATNLAVHLTSLQKTVVVMDANFQTGSVAIFLDIQPKISLTDLLRDIDQIDPQSLKRVLPKHQSGIYFLPPPKATNGSYKVLPGDLSKMFGLLRQEYDYIVVDLDRFVDETTALFLDETDLLLLVVNLDVPSLVNTNRTLDLLQKLGFDLSKTLLVSNRHASQNEYMLEEFQQLVKRSIDWRIPNHKYGDCVAAVNKGEPFASRDGKSKLNKSLMELAEFLDKRFSEAA